MIVKFLPAFNPAWSLFTMILIDKMTETKRSYFYDKKTKTLYVNIPADEGKKVQIKF